MKKFGVLGTLLMCVGLAAVRCSSSIAGNSSETQNGYAVVSVCASSISVKTEPGALVAIFDTSYYPLVPLLNRPSASDSAITDARGLARFDSLPAGGYHLFVFDSSVSRGVLMELISIGERMDTVDLSDSLYALGRLVGRASEGSTQSLRMSVYLKGTPFGAVVDSLGNFAIGPLPAGTYQFNKRHLLFMTGVENAPLDSLDFIQAIRPQSEVPVTVEWGLTTVMAH